MISAKFKIPKTVSLVADRLLRNYVLKDTLFMEKSLRASVVSILRLENIFDYAVVLTI
jgi:hypothetical protein